MLLRHVFWLLPAWCPACIAPHAAYLTIPVVNRAGIDIDRAVVWVPLTELAARMDDFDPGSVAFYVEGRTPLPYRALDIDGDDRPDFAALAMRVRGDGSTRLIVVSPGPPAPGESPGDPPTSGVELQLDQARD